eukprot:s132_g29.t1
MKFVCVKMRNGKCFRLLFFNVLVSIVLTILTVAHQPPAAVQHESTAVSETTFTTRTQPPSVMARPKQRLTPRPKQRLTPRPKQPLTPRPKQRLTPRPKQATTATSNRAFAGSPLYGHVHVPKTAGSAVNVALASKYERVCGHKGYSYDFFQAKLRRFRAETNDSIGQSFPSYSRLRVPFQVMDEIGFEDCDFVSQERDWGWWKRFSSWNVSVELHLPCRDPIDHLLSYCNFLKVPFNCQGDLIPQIKQCLGPWKRFHPSLNGSKQFPNFRMKCFRNELTSTYIEYIGTKLQRKRFESTYVHIPSNLPRNKSNECLWSNESAKLTVARYLNELDYYKFCNDCLDSPQDLLAGSETSNGLEDGNKIKLPHNFVLYGHIHMAQTRGSDLNGALALNYERVCGHKGYSYDAFQANDRFWKNPAGIDSVGQRFATFSRLRVPYEVMDEIGYEDCDFVSQERDWPWWKKFASWNVSVELHLPCPDPIDHLLSTCHFLNISFRCEGDLAAEIESCLVFSTRFHPSLNGSKEFPNFRMKCFRDEFTSTYIEYMGTKLQRKRFESTYVHIPSNLPRNKSKECLWSNESARHSDEEFEASPSNLSEVSDDAMGCTGSTAGLRLSRHGGHSAQWEEDFYPDPLEQNDLDALDSSYDTWRWRHLPKGCVGQPTRRLHEKHMKKLKMMMQGVDENPWVLASDVKRRRDLEGWDMRTDMNGRICRVSL